LERFGIKYYLLFSFTDDSCFRLVSPAHLSIMYDGGYFAC